MYQSIAPYPEQQEPQEILLAQCHQPDPSTPLLHAYPIAARLRDMGLSDVFAHVPTAFQSAKGQRGEDGGEEVEDEAGRVCEAQNSSYKPGEAGSELCGA